MEIVEIADPARCRCEIGENVLRRSRVRVGRPDAEDGGNDRLLSRWNGEREIVVEGREIRFGSRRGDASDRSRTSDVERGEHGVDWGGNGGADGFRYRGTKGSHFGFVVHRLRFGSSVA